MMDEYTREKIKAVVNLAVLVVCVVLVILGHGMGADYGSLKWGIAGLGVQLVGLAGILVLLYLYNKSHRK